MNRFAPPGQRFLVTTVLAALLHSVPAAAYLPPDLSERRTQIVQMLPYSDVAALHLWVAELPVELSPHEYLDRLQARFPNTPRSVAWVFYAGWNYLDRLDLTQQAYVQRLRDLETGAALLRAYEKRITATFRAEVEPAEPAVLQLAPAATEPQNDTSDEGLFVLRMLPWPERYSRAEREKLLEASRADLQAVQAQAGKIEGARQRFVQNQDRWTAWLSEVAAASNKWTAGQYLAPFGAGMPVPPQ